MSSGATCAIASGESVSACQQSLEYFKQAVATEQAKRDASLQVWTKYRSAYTTWQNAYSAWQTAKTAFQRNWEAGRTLTASKIWDGNAVADCDAVPKATYKDVFGLVTYTRNCNDVPGSTAAKCNSCGYYRCDCTAGLDQWCKTGRCGEYRYNSNYSAYPGPVAKTWGTAEAEWLVTHPIPRAPSAPDGNRYPDYTNIPWTQFPNIICQSCSQCMSFNNLTADKIDISQLQQSCVNKLQPPVVVPPPYVPPYVPPPYVPPTTSPPYTPPYTPSHIPSTTARTLAPVPISQSGATSESESDDGIQKKIMMLVLLLILVVIMGALIWYATSGSGGQPQNYSSFMMPPIQPMGPMPMYQAQGYPMNMYRQ